MTPVRLSQSDALLCDIIDQLNMIRYFTAGQMRGKFTQESDWKKYVLGGPEPMERPLNQREPEAKKKVPLTHPRDVMNKIGAIMHRKITRQMIGR